VRMEKSTSSTWSKIGIALGDRSMIQACTAWSFLMMLRPIVLKTNLHPSRLQGDSSEFASSLPTFQMTPAPGDG
jgi:hypothetical protein